MALPLFDLTPKFDSGIPLTTEDHVRLGAQILRVRDVLWGGKWWTVPAIGAEIHARFGVRDPEPSISAQIRNLKKAKHGGHVIERKRDAHCPLYYFRLVREDQ